MDPLFIRIVYAANILVAGGFGFISLLFPEMAARVIFGSVWRPNPAMQLIGCFWLAIAGISALGIFSPWIFSPVLLVQLFYKGGWILFWALPVMSSGDKSKIPVGLFLFFLVWVVVLAFATPWTYLFKELLYR